MATKKTTTKANGASEERVEELGRDLCTVLDLTPPSYICRHGYSMEDKGGVRFRRQDPNGYHDDSFKSWTARIFTDTMEKTHSKGSRVRLSAPPAITVLGVYIAKLNDALAICRIQPLVCGGLRVLFDNEAYEPHTIKKEDIGDLGRLFVVEGWVGDGGQRMIEEARELGIIPTWQ